MEPMEQARKLLDGVVLQNTLLTVAQKAIEGMATDGSHHKRYYLQEIAKMIQASQIVNSEPGIAP